jgi:hypothetical protein
MKKTLMPFILLFSFSLMTNSQVTLDYYLPKTIDYNKSVPTPKQFFGHEIGEWHLSHDRLYSYMVELAKASDRAIWEEYGRSYENRPLGQLIISSPENIKNLDNLRQEHEMLCDPSLSARADLTGMPLFVKLGYGIHGNESSAQNASALVAYYLIAGEGSVMDELLKNTIILIDPSLNPDGMQRHSSWVNSTRSLNNNPDPASMEFSESWPGGRTNHYWFDLNRDYIMLQQPESKGRVEAFHKWKPNINTDHHETGANETFFFQPGIQSRNNPLTPKENGELTAEIGKYHEKHLNSIGSLYFTEESFDDFYVGKGSSYPDIHGSVGILFEQAGVKGHLRETPGGLLSFPFAIRNQFTVSLSTLEAGLNMRIKLLESQRNFYRDALVQADRHPVKAYIFSEPSDNARVSEFINILLQHRIKVYRTNREITKNGITYKPEESYLVPLTQPEYRFIRSLFEPVTEFTDSLFYDTSTWVLPMSFNLNCSPITIPKEMTGLTGREVTETPVIPGSIESVANPYAWLFEWNEYYSPKALYYFQKLGLKTRVATESFVYDDGTLKKKFSQGTIIIPVAGQPVAGDELYRIIQDKSKDFGITAYGVQTGMTKEGIDLGSNRILVLEKPSVAMLAGDGANSGDAGEIWHMLDTRFSIPVTMITASRFGSADLSKYNVLIITGSPDISPSGIENIRSWNRNGGTIIGYEAGNNWLSRNKFAEIEFLPAVTDKKKEGVYINRSADSQVQQIPGSIFRTKLDLTHPLCFGYTRDILPVFKSTVTVAKKDQNIYNNPIVYTDDPLLSGYCTKENIERIKGAPFASVHGRGVISLYDNTNFRAYWYGTDKVFMNAIFFGQIIR